MRAALRATLQQHPTVLGCHTCIPEHALVVPALEQDVLQALCDKLLMSASHVLSTLAQQRC